MMADELVVFLLWFLCIKYTEDFPTYGFSFYQDPGKGKDLLLLVCVLMVFGLMDVIRMKLIVIILIILFIVPLNGYKSLQRDM